MKKEKIVFAIIVLARFLLDWFYRPYIYKNNLFDFYFADVFPSLLILPLITSFYIAFFNTTLKKVYKYAFIIFGVNIIGELGQLVNNTFDYKDLIAITIGFLITLAVINKYYTNSEIYITASLNKVE